MSVGGKFVIDAVTHAFDARPENEKGKYAHSINEANFSLQWTHMPDPYRIPRDKYFIRNDADTLMSALFRESDTDVAFYHTIPTWGVHHDHSPVSVAMEIRDRFPGRMFVYGAASPLEGQKALDDIQYQAEEWRIHGVKLYPVDFIDGKMQSYSLSDERLVFPFLQRCRDIGIRTIAIHKSLPLGGAPMDPFRPGDVDYAAIDFPDLNFEIVHGGFAFLEETASQISRLPNVYVNLEANTLLLMKQPRAFANMLGLLLREGGPEKLFWGTGAMAVHPAPLLDAFEKFEMPQDLIEGFGYPEVTDEIKGKILAENYASIHGLNVGELRAAIQDDELSKQRRESPAPPWSGLNN